MFEIPEESIAKLKEVRGWKKKAVVELDEYHIPYQLLCEVERKLKKVKECWVEPVNGYQLRIHYRTNSGEGHYEIYSMGVYQYTLKGKWKESMLRYELVH